MIKPYVFARDKFDDTIKKVYISEYDRVVMTIGEKIEYKGQEIEVTDLVFYEKGYTGKVTHEVKCVILK